MKYLVETTEIYRVDSEEAAKLVIEEAKKASSVSKYNCIYKSKKQKGEIVDEWYRVSITKRWTDEKEPDDSVEVTYSKNLSW